MIFTSVIVTGLGVSDAWAAQLDTEIDPANDSSPFTIKYLKTISIDYSNGGMLYDAMNGDVWTISGESNMSNPGVQNLAEQLNQKIVSDGSQSQVTDLMVSYDFSLRGNDTSATLDTKIQIEGQLEGYIIIRSSNGSQIDLGWRGLSVKDPVVIDGTDINILLNLLEVHEPGIHKILAGTEADEIFETNLIDADFLLEQPMTNWHFLFDPTGISASSVEYGISDAISGIVVSEWTMGESSLREGRQIEQEHEVELMLDQPYTITSIQSADAASVSIIGYGVLDRFSDGVEFAGVTPERPAGTGDTGSFSVMIMYGMAGMAAVAGVVFFFVSNRSLKNEKQGQQGIDPSRLVGYQTSASSGGYQTNRGEAQLRDDAGYQQTRNVYDTFTQQRVEPTPQPPPSPPPQLSASAPDPASEDAACGCAASADMGSECDCEMQSSCLCDATCGCSASICKDHSASMT